MIRVRRLLYTVSNKPEAKSFQPKLNSCFNRAKENCFLGLHLTVSQRIRVSTALLNRDWAMIAQAPKPIMAMPMPTKAAPMVPPSVEKKNRLNIMFLET